MSHERQVSIILSLDHIVLHLIDFWIEILQDLSLLCEILTGTQETGKLLQHHEHEHKHENLHEQDDHTIGTEHLLSHLFKSKPNNWFHHIILFEKFLFQYLSILIKKSFNYLKSITSLFKCIIAPSHQWFILWSLQIQLLCCPYTNTLYCKYLEHIAAQSYWQLFCPLSATMILFPHYTNMLYCWKYLTWKNMKCYSSFPLNKHGDKSTWHLY